ncbi:MAG: hypothetical protein IJB97_10715, partial [Clostridia bacterium]|nr:hypothetical protein [Clostridia bacterium]
NRIELLKKDYALWDASAVTGESFPNQAEIAASVFIDGAQVVGQFVLVGEPKTVELVGNTIKAVSQGAETVTVAYKNNQAVTAQFTVTVYGKSVSKDGGEMLFARTEKSTYAKVADGTSIGGRTGVYAFTNTASACWNDRLAVYESSHPVGGDSASRTPFKDSVAAHANMRAKQYNYVTIDVYLTAGSGLKVCTVNSEAASKSNYYEVGKKLSEVLRMENDCISLYDGTKKLALTDTVEAGKWYTVVVDYAATKAPASNSVWSAIEFAGCFGTLYVDSVQYWFVNPYAA